MSQNIKALMVEDIAMRPDEVLQHLADQVPGRDIGERYVTASKINDVDDLEIELDDGSKYAFQCRKVN